ncbi:MULTISPECIES: hypothetical protein [Brevibacterium]|jgi:hypothetical protein|uniref:Uncharacterized protein n=1 Tax=Brevibacterium salitolerans TaxID=1403566 RepID=A0ABN2WKA8_9MICO|nr:hypothetical protein [Brevibacterium sp.]
MPVNLPRHERLPRMLASAAAMRPLLQLRHPGTNGWISSWGTNAHGEIAGCPPRAH